jgi:hypothetical protein
MIKKWPLKQHSPAEGRWAKSVAPKWRTIIVEKSFYARRHLKSSARRLEPASRKIE